MNLLFVHQNMPGQYRELLAWLAARDRHRIVFLTQRAAPPPAPGITVRTYRPHHSPAPEAYALSRPFEAAMGTAYSAFLAARALKEEGFSPDLILGHTGWGELTFLKDVWPTAPILGYWEYYYLAQGGPIGFDPEFPAAEAAPLTTRARNALNHLCLPLVDLGQCPTDWQMATFPKPFRQASYICHDGIRTDRLGPNPSAAVPLARLARPLSRADEVFTYMARNMEPARGFHIFMRALPAILEARPAARALLIGGSETSYGPASGESGGYRGRMERELGDRVDWSRVHFLGRVPYADFQRILSISRCHVYLTVPFVLSWSLIEAMAMEATIVASDTAPVREVLRHGRTAILTDFLDPAALAARVAEVLARPADFAHLGPAARRHAVARYDFLTRTLPVHIEKINGLLPRKLAIRLPSG